MPDQQPVIPGTWIGMAVGLFLGLIAVQDSLGHALAVAVCGLAGYWFAAFRRGDVDLVEGLSRLQQRDRTFR